MNWIPTLILSLFVLAGTGSLIYAWVAYQRGQQSLAWPSVAGTVTASTQTPDPRPQTPDPRPQTPDPGDRCIAKPALRW